MNKNTAIIIGIIVLAVTAFGVYASLNEKENVMTTKESMGQKGIEEKMIDEKGGEATMSKDEANMIDAGDVMIKAGSYEAYGADKLARAETGDVVLFFHASWCPSCRALNGSIESNLKSIPEGVTILKTDYDKETELKKKYGVTYQHTLVQVDKDGNMIKKWSGGSTLDNLLSQIKSR